MIWAFQHCETVHVQDLAIHKHFLGLKNFVFLWETISVIPFVDQNIVE